MVKRKTSSSGQQSPSEIFSPRSNDSRSNTQDNDPTSGWSLNIGVRRTTAFAGTREKVRMAEARGAAERGDQSGSSGEKPPPSKRRWTSLSMESSSSTRIDPQATAAAAKTFAKYQAAYQKAFVKKHKKDKGGACETATEGSKQRNDRAQNKAAMAAAAVTASKSTLSTVRNVKSKTAFKYPTSGKHKQKDLVASVAACHSKTTVPSRSMKSIGDLKSPTTQLLQPSPVPPHPRAEEVSSFRNTTAGKSQQEDSATNASRSRQVPHTTVTSSTEITSKVHKKRKGNFVTTGSKLSQKPSAIDNFEDEKSDGNASSLSSTHSFLAERRPRKVARKEHDNNTGECFDEGIIEFSITKKAPILTLLEGISHFQPQNSPQSNDSSSSSPSASMEEYRQKIDKRELPKEFPRTGTPQQLPSICLRGKWQADWTVEREVGDVAANDKDGKDKLSGYRLCLRHTSRLKIGALPPIVHGKTAFDVPVEGETKDKSTSNIDQGNIVVSCMFPLKKRHPKLLSLKSEKKEDGHHRTFVGSICLVGRMCVDSSRDTASKTSGGMEQEVLEHIKHEGSDDDNDDDLVDHERSGRPLMFPVTETESRGCVGVFIPCALPLDTKYHIRFAQDQSFKDNPIVAVDVVFNEVVSALSSLAAPARTPAQAGDERRVPSPLSEESLKQHTQKVGYVDILDSMRKDDDPWDITKSHRRQKDAKSSKKKAAIAAPFKGHREDVPKNRYAPPSSSSEDEGEHFNGTGNQNFSPASKDSWATNPKLPVSIVPRENDRMSAPRPKSLAQKFDEEASRDSKKTEQATSTVAESPGAQKKPRAKSRPADIFRKSAAKRKQKIAMAPTKASSGPKQVKKEIDTKRLLFNSPPGKTQGKNIANLSSKVVPPTPAAQTNANQTQTPNSFGSWSDDWESSSLHGSDFEPDNVVFDVENPSIFKQAEKSTQNELDIDDAGLLLSENDSFRCEGNEEYATTKAIGEDTGKVFKVVPFTRKRLLCHPRNVPHSKKRWWISAIALFLAFGGGYKESVPQGPAIMGSMRQKKRSLPPPIRLTNKSFSLKFTIW